MGKRMGIACALGLLALASGPGCGVGGVLFGQDSADAGGIDTAGDDADDDDTGADDGVFDTPDGNPGAKGCRKVDLLFVVDDSASMTDQQVKLTEAFPAFMATIDAALVAQKGIDYHVGVVSPEMGGEDMCIFGLCAEGHRGRLLHEPDRIPCDAEPAGRWIETGPVDRVTDEFECIASIRGQDFIEMPLEAARAALTDRVTDAEGYNAGFLRDDALLVVVVLSDEDDQSRMHAPETWDPFFGPGPVTPVSGLYQALVDVKGGDPQGLVVVVLAGDADTGCDDDDGEPIVTKAPRLHELLDLAAPNSYWGDLCGDALTQPLQDALEVIDFGCEEFVPPAG